MKSETQSRNGAPPSGAGVTTALPRPQIARRPGTATLKTGRLARIILHQGLGGLLIFLAIGCDKPIPTPPPPPNLTATERVFDTGGIVRSVPNSGQTLVVRHDEIPGYMPKMTMELNVRDTNELRGIERDDEITFQLVATADTHWIQNLKRVGKATPDAAPASLPPGIQIVKELEAGDALPDYELLAEDGRPVRFSDFRGQALAFTFIFSRCPLPDFCPRMGNNFARARELILAQPNAPTNWQFLSISFDPEFDTPAALRSYAQLYRHDNPDRWRFAAAPLTVLSKLAPELDLMFAREASGSISHNLRTVVLDPQGRIHQQFDGNQWTPDALAKSLLAAASLRATEPADATAHHATQRIEISGVQNAFRATERIYSGSQPEGDAAFAAIAKLGIKTLISVDGSQPDVEAARKYGLRYIHLPFGYDGVPTNRVAELAKAAASGAGPFFVHCHHGKHRGPTAVAVMCRAGDGWTAEHAAAWLHAAGTAEEYAGLYRAAREFQAPTADQLAAVKELPEIARTSSLVEAMVAIDAHLDHLKRSQDAGWKTPPGHADVSPAHEATMLWEQFRELGRTDDTAKRTEDYRVKLTSAEHATDSLHKLLREPADTAAINAAFKTTGQTCAACHKKYRNE